MKVTSEDNSLKDVVDKSISLVHQFHEARLANVFVHAFHECLDNASRGDKSNIRFRSFQNDYESTIWRYGP